MVRENHSGGGGVNVPRGVSASALDGAGERRLFGETDAGDDGVAELEAVERDEGERLGEPERAHLGRASLKVRLLFVGEVGDEVLVEGEGT